MCLSRGGPGGAGKLPRDSGSGPRRADPTPPPRRPPRARPARDPPGPSDPRREGNHVRRSLENAALSRRRPAGNRPGKRRGPRGPGRGAEETPTGLTAPRRPDPFLMSSWIAFQVPKRPDPLPADRPLAGRPGGAREGAAGREVGRGREKRGPLFGARSRRARFPEHRQCIFYEVAEPGNFCFGRKLGRRSSQGFAAATAATLLDTVASLASAVNRADTFL